MNMVKLMMAGLLMELEIPTEYFTNKNLKICSPNFGYVHDYNVAFRVEPDGDVSIDYYDVGSDSYGMIYITNNKICLSLSVL